MSAFDGEWATIPTNTSENRNNSYGAVAYTSHMIYTEREEERRGEKRERKRERERDRE